MRLEPWLIQRGQVPLFPIWQTETGAIQICDQQLDEGDYATAVLYCSIESDTLDHVTGGDDESCEAYVHDVVPEPVPDELLQSSFSWSQGGEGSGGGRV